MFSTAPPGTPRRIAQWNRVHLPHDFSIETLGEDLGGVLLTSEWISPLVVPLALLAFLGWADKPVVIWRRLRWELLAYVVFVIAAWWLFTHRIDRFWIPVLPVLALLAGAGHAGVPSVGGVAFSRGCCWPVWWRTSWCRRPVPAMPGSFRLDGLRNDPAGSPRVHWYFNNDADRGSGSDGRRRGRLRPEAASALQHLLRRLRVREVGERQNLEGESAGEAASPGQGDSQGIRGVRIAYILVDWSEIKRYRDSYGFTDFVQPEVFDQLVKEGILELVPQNKEPWRRLYRVKW